MDSTNNNDITPNIKALHSASYEQLLQLLTAASNCIKASNDRISKLEAEVKTLKERRVYILAADDEQQT